MGKINWGRVVLCGLLTGVVYGALEIAKPLAFVGRDFLAALPRGAQHPPTIGDLLRISLLWFLMGIWIMWLYAAIRPRYGPGPKTAAIAGLATWVSVILVDCVWAWLGFVPPATLVVPLAGAVPVFIIAAVAGAWRYKE